METLPTLVPGAASRSSPRAPPLALGRYRLIERLGAGGFGVVWRAHDEVLEREVALKRVPLPAAGGGERAAREALAAARLCHPAIVSLYEACAEGDSFVLVSELVRGPALATLIASRSLADRAVAEIGLALTDALEHAHARGVIHRDVKPQNVLVPDHPDEGGAVAKLADFGGATLVGEESLTRTGDVIGTLAYMAPEQADGGEATEAADLYSLALVLYESFADVNPVRGATPAATARKLGSRLPSLAAPRPDLPRSLTRAIDVALDPRPHRRRSPGELAAAVADALESDLSTRRGRRRARAPAAPPAEMHTDTAVAALAAPSATSPPTHETRPRPMAPWASEPSARVGARGHSAGRAAPAVRLGAGGRLAGALAAAALVATAASAPAVAGTMPTLGAPVAAVVAGGAVGLAPRVGWVAVASAIVTWAAAAGHSGVAVLIAAAALAVVLLLRRPGPGWSGPAVAPLLGLVGLAGVYPALAGQAARWPRRAALGALGYWWLCLAEPLIGRLWIGAPPQAGARAWTGSAGSAVTHVVWPLLSNGTLLGALLWAAGAALLPWLVSGRALSLDIVGATVWAAALYVAAPVLDRGPGTHLAVSPRGAVAGAVIAAALAVGARAARRGKSAGALRAGRRRPRASGVSRPL